MARLFVAASSQYLYRDDGIITVHPLSISAWVYPTSTASSTIFDIADSATNSQGWVVSQPLVGASDARFRCSTRNAGSAAATSSLNIFAAINQWYHVLSVFGSPTSRIIYVNGGNSGSDATSKTPGGTINRTSIGRGLTGSYYSGRIAEPAVWNVALTEADAVLLSRGVSPLRLYPRNLKGYWNIFGTESPEPDKSGNGFELTLNGTPAIADHPPVQPPFGFDMGWQGTFGGVATGASAVRQVVRIPFTVWNWHWGR